MKKLLLGVCLLFLAAFAKAQGLESLIIEKYYVSNAADAAGSSGTLPVGSVTYRFYVDMAAGYNFQLAFGDAGHPLKFKTTTKFFNNTSRGATTPAYSVNPYLTGQATENSVMLDSYLSVGQVSNDGYLGVLKSEDDAANTVPHPVILQNTDPIAGVPLTGPGARDGHLPGVVPDVTILPGFNLSAIGSSSQVGDSVGTISSGWSALGGSVGPTASNRILIAQLTTDGTLTYQLNIQLGDPDGGTEVYIPAGSQADGQQLATYLAGSIAPDVRPTVSITYPANGAIYSLTGNPAQDTVQISAIASDDVDFGTVDSVTFFVDGVRIDVDNSAPFGPIVWPAVVGAHQLTAVATDNDLGQTTSSVVNITVQPNHAPYGFVTTNNLCGSSGICQMVAAQDVVSNIIGYDVVLHYDASKVVPTGVITVQSDLVNPSYTDYVTSIVPAQSKMLISVFFRGSAPTSARFNGIGNIFCAEFNKAIGFNAADSATFTADSIQESYFTGVSRKAVDQGKYKTYRDSSFNSSLRFWATNSPLAGGNSALYLPTNVQGNPTCSAPAGPVVNPDVNGVFNYNVANGFNINIVRNILPATDVQPVINGYDAFLTRRMLILDPTFNPTVYQAIAMDVNRDGVISAGDLSQIDQRAVLVIGEFKQAWNYTTSGTRINPGNPLFDSYDWYFVPSATVAGNLAYSRSTSFPGDDGVGFSRNRVPVPATCLSIPQAGPLSCQIANSETYYGDMIGDVDGSFASVGSNGGTLRMNTADQVVFDFSNAVVSGGYVEIPVSVLSVDAVNSLDFQLQFNNARLTYVSIVDKVNYLQEEKNIVGNNTLKFTSYSLQNYETGKTLFTVRFAINANVEPSDLTPDYGMLNGRTVPAVVNTVPTGVQDIKAANFVSIYPNPASEMLNVAVAEKATVELMDMNGRLVMEPISVNAGQKQVISTSTLANGVYTMKVSNDNFVTMKQVVINK